MIVCASGALVGLQRPPPPFSAPSVATGVGSKRTSDGSHVVIDRDAGEPGSQELSAFGHALAQPGVLEPGEAESAVEQSGPGEERSTGRHKLQAGLGEQLADRPVNRPIPVRVAGRFLIGASRAEDVPDGILLGLARGLIGSSA